MVLMTSDEKFYVTRNLDFVVWIRGSENPITGIVEYSFAILKRNEHSVNY